MRLRGVVFRDPGRATASPSVLLARAAAALTLLLAACGSPGQGAGGPGLPIDAALDATDQADGNAPPTDALGDLPRDFGASGDLDAGPDTPGDAPGDIPGDAGEDTPPPPDGGADAPAEDASDADAPADDAPDADASADAAGDAPASDVPCVPQCEGVTCADDGCGGWCGGCPCDDGVCDLDETPESCPQDCGACGDGVCAGHEAELVGPLLACPQDCAPVCGDGACDPGETAEGCPFDCGTCGDMVCGAGETGCTQDCFLGCGDGLCNGFLEPFTCPIDCAMCGDGRCDPNEAPASCPSECATCGDGLCTGGEDAASCFGDCSPLCGDGACRGGETPASCPADCGPCGDGVCGLAESPATCPVDCPPGCGDGACDGDEGEATCPVDCACLPQCEERECGLDPCGHLCGQCGPGLTCLTEGPDAGTCACVPDCAGKVCGDDGCGGSCGGCPTGQHCEAGQCACDFATCQGVCCAQGEVCDGGACCQPQCEATVGNGVTCGDDGCGGSCGDCPFAHACEAGQCVLQVFCGNQVCEPEADEPEDCATCPADCGCGPDGLCQGGACCYPACDGLDCGPDGCGGSCGSCDALSTCVDGLCACDFEACGGGCCAQGEVCQDGACCQPQCDGKACGDDGCGGSCGGCPDPYACGITGQCECWDVVWTHTYGSGKGSTIYAVAPDGTGTPDAPGGFVFAGKDAPGGSFDDLWVGRVDAAGATLWSHTYSGGATFSYDAAFGVAGAGDGGLLACGKVDGSKHQGWARRLDPDGATLWTKSFGGAGFNVLQDVTRTATGSWLLTGQVFSSTSYRAWRVELDDADGSTLDSGNWYVPYFAEFKGVTALSGGGYAYTGGRGTNGSLADDDYVGGTKMWVLRVDDAQATVWSHTYGTTPAEGYAVAEMPDGGVVAVGNTSGGAGGRDLYVVRLSQAGSKLWELVWGYGADDSARDVLVTDDGHVLVVGYLTSGGARDLVLLELDDAGQIVWQARHGGPGTQAGYTLAAVPGEPDRFVVGGRSDGSGWLMKYGRCAPLPASGQGP